MVRHIKLNIEFPKCIIEESLKGFGFISSNGSKRCLAQKLRGLYFTGMWLSPLMQPLQLGVRGSYCVLTCESFSVLGAGLLD